MFTSPPFLHDIIFACVLYPSFWIALALLGRFRVVFGECAFQMKRELTERENSQYRRDVLSEDVIIDSL
jgi:hypothetical protein